jgi:hypothetical protein
MKINRLYEVDLMSNGQRKVKPAFWMVLLFGAVIIWAVIADWWKTNSVLGWVIVGLVVIAFGFSLYKFKSVRGWFIGSAKSVVKRAVYEEEVPTREPLPPEVRESILNRAEFHCENPDCRQRVKPVIHHIDQNNSHNRKNNLVALCPNCHTRAHQGELTMSQLRNWVNMSWASYKRNHNIHY